MTGPLDALKALALCQVAVPLAIAQVPVVPKLAFLGKDKTVHSYPPYTDDRGVLVSPLRPARLTTYRFEVAYQQFDQRAMTEYVELNISGVTGRLLPFIHPTRLGDDLRNGLHLGMFVFGFPGMVLGMVPVALYRAVRGVQDLVTGLTAHDRALLGVIRDVVSADDYTEIGEAYRLYYEEQKRRAKPLSREEARKVLQSCVYAEGRYQQGAVHEKSHHRRFDKLHRYWYNDEGECVAHYRTTILCGTEFTPANLPEILGTSTDILGELKVYGQSFPMKMGTDLAMEGRECIHRMLVPRSPCPCCDKTE